MVATAEVKTVLPQADPHWQSGHVTHRVSALPGRGGPAPASEGTS